MTFDEIMSKWNRRYEKIRVQERTSHRGNRVVSGWGQIVWYDLYTRQSGTVVYDDLWIVVAPDGKVLEYRAVRDDDSEYQF